MVLSSTSCRFSTSSLFRNVPEGRFWRRSIVAMALVALRRWRAWSMASWRRLPPRRRGKRGRYSSNFPATESKTETCLYESFECESGPLGDWYSVWTTSRACSACSTLSDKVSSVSMRSMKTRSASKLQAFRRESKFEYCGDTSALLEWEVLSLSKEPSWPSWAEAVGSSAEILSRRVTHCPRDPALLFGQFVPSPISDGLPLRLSKHHAPENSTSYSLLSILSSP